MGRFDHVLLASDFDNTLVYTQGALERGEEVPPMPMRNRQALEEFLTEGGMFAISTGRAVPAFASYASTVPMNVPSVVANGAGIYDFQKNQYLRTAFLDENIYVHIHEVVEAFPELSFEIYHVDRRIHAVRPNEYILAHEHLTRAPFVEIKSIDEAEPPLLKLLFEEDSDTLAQVEAFIRSRPWSNLYELIYSNDTLLEMTAHGATKGGMVLQLAELLGVARKNIYCIGDHRNDLPMLEISAIPFAPANCVQELRDFGAHIVSHCADGAVADVIELLKERYPVR